MQKRPFRTSNIWIAVALSICLSQATRAAEIVMNPLVVNTGNSFSFFLTARNTAELSAFEIRLHLPMEVISKIKSIDPARSDCVLEPGSYYDETLKSVVWTVKGTFAQPVSGNIILCKVTAVASAKAGYSNLGIAVVSGELLGSFVHGGSIYVLDPAWPWYDIQINYQKAFNRLDFDHSGRIDRTDLLTLTMSWHQTLNTDLPEQPTATPTPVSTGPTPTPLPHTVPSIEEFLGTWTFDFLHNTLIGLDVHITFNALLNEDGAIILQGKYQTDFLGTYTYNEETGTITGVFMINNTNPLNPLDTIDYFVNFEGEAGAGNTITGSARFSYNSMDIQIAGYESYGLTLTDPGNFTAVQAQ